MYPETEQLLTLLRSAMRVLGLSAREVERRMGLSPGYLSRVLSGKVELKVDHVCAIASAIGLEPAEVFRLAFSSPSQPPTPAAATVRKALRLSSPADAADAPAPPASESSPEQIEELLEKTLRRLFHELGRERAD